MKGLDRLSLTNLFLPRTGSVSFSCFKHGYCLDLFIGQHLPVDSFGPHEARLDIDNFRRRDNGGKRDVVLGHGKLVVDDLQGVDRGDNGRCWRGRE